MHVLVISRNTWGGGAWLNNWGYTCIYFCEDFLTKCLGADLANLLYLYVCPCPCGNTSLCNGAGFYSKSFQSGNT